MNRRVSDYISTDNCCTCDLNSSPTLVSRSEKNITPFAASAITEKHGTIRHTDKRIVAIFFVNSSSCTFLFLTILIVSINTLRLYLTLFMGKCLLVCRNSHCINLLTTPFCFIYPKKNPGINRSSSLIYIFCCSACIAFCASTGIRGWC